MPKVSAQYLAKKKKEIVEAAIRVCSTKPAYEITLRDVVRECGISTGGIYNYFASIDEIFIEILNQAYTEFPYSTELSKVFNSGRPAAEIIVEVFQLQGRLIDSMYGRYGKFMMELDVILLNDPQRGQRMIAQSIGNSESSDFLEKLFMLISSHIAEGTFNPEVPLQHILFVTIGAVEGVHKAIIAPEHVKDSILAFGLTEEECATAQGMMKVLAKTLLNLLGCQTQKPIKE